MKLLILIATLITAATSFDGVSQYWPLSMAWLRAASTVDDLLNVCESSNIQRQVVETLQMATDNFQRLSTAIDQDDLPSFLDIIQTWQQQISRNVQAVEGTINATIKAYTSSSASSKDIRCAQRLFSEVKNLHQVVESVQAVTSQSIRIFKQSTDDMKFYKIQQPFKGLFDEIDRFHQNPKNFRPLNQACKASWKPTTIPDIFENLEQYTNDSKTYDEEQRRNAVEVATGLVAQALNLNAVCDAVVNVDKDVELFKDTVKNDIQVSKDALDQLESIVESIVGQRGFFKRLFGY